ncbi:class I SAM-dependent methyltransferase [Leptospira yasudae]|uniref:SAM-dependent methyltransferase n=1 Tax=Leptospira yasudae TaxID=2202201 RepID=A0A6N4R170_9LEPT|nr:class I SAM-dependent methyltransferase [Leptospira yasudae]TGL82079.1 SAM-dependent methyltransferase [Leptospira yasudae]TGL83176.1 SAM-dependent methyltransferase [Leptospira yasudae]TGL87436.1 SAM-dependent methyltransferase [Leptospira yasudae]
MCVQKTPTLSIVNARIFQILQNYIHYKYRKIKRDLFEELPDTLVELGPGVGSNLRYFRPGTTLLAIEPNVGMHSLLKKNAETYSVKLELMNLSAEKLPFSDSSVDAVVCSWVLCTVEKPDQVLKEVKRVLKPGGKFVFLEHVAAERGSFLEWIQKIVLKHWKWLFEGCHLNRDTSQTLHNAGFSSLTIETISIPTFFLPIRPHIYGTAIK